MEVTENIKGYHKSKSLWLDGAILFIFDKLNIPVGELILVSTPTDAVICYIDEDNCIQKIYGDFKIPENVKSVWDIYPQN